MTLKHVLYGGVAAAMLMSPAALAQENSTSGDAGADVNVEAGVDAGTNGTAANASADASMEAGSQARVRDIADETERQQALDRLIGQSFDNTVATSADAEVTINSVSEMFDEDVARGLEQSAEASAEAVEGTRLKVSADNVLLKAVQDAGFTAEDVLAVQLNADGSVDIFVR